MIWVSLQASEQAELPDELSFASLASIQPLAPEKKIFPRTDPKNLPVTVTKLPAAPLGFEVSQVSPPAQSESAMQAVSGLAEQKPP